MGHWFSKQFFEYKTKGTGQKKKKKDYISFCESQKKKTKQSTD